MEQNTNENILQEIGKTLKSARKEKRLKQATVALEAKITQAEISRIEQGKYECLKVNTLLQLMQYFNIPVIELHSKL
jgi:transcriptional regulator with XRE-family HTH domain